jgi:hypothetical protein
VTAPPSEYLAGPAVLDDAAAAFDAFEVVVRHAAAELL